MVLCLIVGCGNKTEKRWPSAEKLSFLCVPRVVVNQGEYVHELTSERRRRWISAISRDDLTELVMADRGFTISESVGLYQAQLAIPAFTRGKNQLDPVDVERTRGIANVRIHVEHVIGLLRQKYTILQSTLPLDYLTCSNNTANCPLIDRMIRICSALINLYPSVVPFE